MADTVRAIYDLKLQIRQTTDVSLDGVANQEHTRETANAATLDASSTPAVSKSWWDDGTLTAGAATIDLTALVRANLPNVDMTGLKVQLFKFIATSTNTAGIRIKVGASNAYNIFGDANGEITLLPGGVHFQYIPEQLPDVASGAKDIDLSSSDTDAGYAVEIVAG